MVKSQLLHPLVLHGITHIDTMGISHFVTGSFSQQLQDETVPTVDYNSCEQSQDEDWSPFAKRRYVGGYVGVQQDASQDDSAEDGVENGSGRVLAVGSNLSQHHYFDYEKTKHNGYSWPEHQQTKRNTLQGHLNHTVEVKGNVFVTDFLVLLLF